MRRFVQVVLLLSAAAWIGGCESNGTQPGDRTQPAQPVYIYYQVTGLDVGLDQPTARVVRDQNELGAIGSPTLNRVVIDFSTRSLVLLTPGRCPTGGYWVQITAIEQQGNRLTIHGIANAPGPDEMVTQAITYPYAAAVIDKTDAGEVSMRVDSVRGEEPPE